MRKKDKNLSTNKSIIRRHSILRSDELAVCLHFERQKNASDVSSVITVTVTKELIAGSTTTQSSLPLSAKQRNSHKHRSSYAIEVWGVVAAHDCNTTSIS